MNIPNGLKSFCLLFSLTVALQVRAQDWKQLKGDDLFGLARTTAFNGKRDEARLMLQKVIRDNPQYYEARIFMARTYYWDEQRNNARRELDTVFQQAPGEGEALNLLIDIELADGNADKALLTADLGLTASPTSETFLYKKAASLVLLDRKEEAGVLLARLLSLNPANTEALSLMDRIKSTSLKNAAGLQYGIDVFNRIYRPANYLSLQLSKLSKIGTGILRLNYSSRFALTGLQGEVDLYPKLTNGMYAYLNYGFSKSELFPLHRFGGEMYSKLPRSLEASLGLRYLYFGSATRVTMFTGSVSLYHKSYLFSFRPFVTASGSGNGFSTVVNARRYGQDGDNYVGVSGGFGFSPDEGRIQSAVGLNSDAVFKLRAQRLWVNWQKTLPGNFIALVSVGVVRQELSFSVGNYVLISNVTVGIRKRY